MSRFFNPDNPVMEFIAKIFDLVILNLIFIFSCVPIITIGASTSALSYVTLKILISGVTSGNHFVRISSREHLYGYFPF